VASEQKLFEIRQARPPPAKRPSSWSRSLSSASRSRAMSSRRRRKPGRSTGSSRSSRAFATVETEPGAFQPRDHAGARWRRLEGESRRAGSPRSRGTGPNCPRPSSDHPDQRGSAHESASNLAEIRARNPSWSKSGWRPRTCSSASISSPQRRKDLPALRCTRSAA